MEISSAVGSDAEAAEEDGFVECDFDDDDDVDCLVFSAVDDDVFFDTDEDEDEVDELDDVCFFMLRS